MSAGKEFDVATPGRRELPAPDVLARGGALAVVAAVLFTVALSLGRKSLFWWPLALGILVVAALSGWAAAIQLTGGERFDDHPWV